MSLNPSATEPSQPLPVLAGSGNRVVLVLGDHLDARPELKKGLTSRGYCVIDTDNGLEATQRALYAHPDLLLVDMDVPLLYEIVAARQILKNARLGLLPVVIFNDEVESDSDSID